MDAVAVGLADLASYRTPGQSRVKRRLANGVSIEELAHGRAQVKGAVGKSRTARVGPICPASRIHYTCAHTQCVERAVGRVDLNGVAIPEFEPFRRVVNRAVDVDVDATAAVHPAPEPDCSHVYAVFPFL